MVTAVFLNQNRMNVCEHTTQMASLVSYEEWMEGNLKQWCLKSLRKDRSMDRKEQITDTKGRKNL